MKILIECKKCDHGTAIEVTEMSHIYWKKGVPVQDAMPYLNSTQRGCIVQDLCPKCLAKEYGYDDEFELSNAKNDDDAVTLKRNCVSCSCVISVTAYKKEFVDWKSGTPAEEALQDLDEFEIDGLISSFCESCQDQLYASLKEDYGDPFTDGVQ